jgi:two-component system, OmpR family, response regulator QseB
MLLFIVHTNMRIFLLEDDLQLGKALQTALCKSGFTTIWVRRVQEANQQLADSLFDMVLLDIGLPDGSGLDVLVALRQAKNQVPVIMLSAKDATEDRISGLDLGADDYLPKPFSIRELISRIQAIKRRSEGFKDETWTIGALTITPKKRMVCLDGEALDLSVKEYSLLIELARNPGQFVTRSRLETTLFQSIAEIESNILEVHIHNLRKKIGSDRIRTLRGVGYLLEQPL